MLVKLGLIVLALQVATFEQVASSDSSEKVYELLTKKEGLETHESLTLLDELRELNYPLDSEDLQNLLHLARQETQDCSLESYEELEKLETKYANFKDTIVALMRKFKWNKFRACKKSYEEKVDKTLENMEGGVEATVKELFDMRLRSLVNPYEDQVNRFVNYLKKNELIMNSKLLKDDERFFNVFVQTIDDICTPYMEDLFDELNIYNLMLPNEDPDRMKSTEEMAETLASNMPNKRMMLWLFWSRSCFITMEDSYLYSGSVREAMRKEYQKNKKNWIQSLFSKEPNGKGKQ